MFYGVRGFGVVKDRCTRVQSLRQTPGSKPPTLNTDSFFFFRQGYSRGLPLDRALQAPPTGAGRVERKHTTQTGEVLQKDKAHKGIALLEWQGTDLRLRIEVPRAEAGSNGVGTSGPSLWYRGNFSPKSHLSVGKEKSARRRV